MTKIEAFFSKFFSNIILKNKVVATVLYTIQQQIKTYKTTFDNNLNTDI
jgi:hypothetical protein